MTIASPDGGDLPVRPNDIDNVQGTTGVADDGVVGTGAGNGAGMDGGGSLRDGDGNEVEEEDDDDDYDDGGDYTW